MLPGSDPLPFPEQVDRAGSYGFLLEEGFEECRPAESLRKALRALESPPRTWGRCRDLTGFCQDQYALRFHRPRRAVARPRLVAPADTASFPWIR